MKLYIVESTGISHMTMHNGQPCDKYCVTVKLSERPLGTVPNYALRVYDDNRDKLEEKVANFHQKGYITIKETDPNLSPWYTLWHRA